MGVSITLPTGGADVTLNSAIEIDNESGGQAGGACRLKFNGSVVSSTVNLTMTDGHNYSLALTAFDNAGAGTRQALVECQGSISDDDIIFVNGDLTVQAFPVGA
jgi:methionine-rich copper-binding protein CopC